MFKKITNGQTSFEKLTTSFNGVVLDSQLKTVDGEFKTVRVEGRGLLDEKHEVTTVPGRHGGYYHSRTYEARTIKVTGILTGKSALGLRKQYQRLANLLRMDEPTWLTFNDEPELGFWAKFSDSQAEEELKDEVVITLSFVCYDPFKYSAEKRQTGTNASILTKSYATDVDIKPLIRVTVKSGTPTYLRILHVAKGQYIRIDLPSSARLKANDVVEFDCQTGSVTINGTNALQYLDMVNSRFFSLSNGSNRLTANVALDWEIIYREVYR